jgi:hypothetical protein
MTGITSSDSRQDTLVTHDSRGQTGDADDIFYRLCTANELNPKCFDMLATTNGRSIAGKT